MIGGARPLPLELPADQRTLPRVRDGVKARGQSVRGTAVDSKGPARQTSSVMGGAVPWSVDRVT